MYLQLQNKTWLCDLHLKTCLSDWDMNEEMKLAATTDQFFQDEKLNDQYLVRWHYARFSRRSSSGMEETQAPLYTEKEESNFQPSLWLMVNPRLACPIKYPQVEQPKPQPGPPLMEPKHSPLPPAPSSQSTREDLSLDESLLYTSSSSEYMFTDDDTSSLDIPVPRKPKSSPKLRKKPLKEKAVKIKSLSKRLQKVLQESNNLKKGCWPRPPINYCILIAMALNSSWSGSLNVQQIYNFTRERFPFFRTAPDGWKNTIRHNLCFSNSFEKTPQLVCSQGKRKSCLWRLTVDGRRRLRREIQGLSGDSFKVLRMSMMEPARGYQTWTEELFAYK
ncbi:forkhead box protein N5 [Huso huso]|uniref:Forkhead box protein N5 n=1 Tax=Huso huso TaxID=61971 RepID=A0ABR0Y688_HUSHU